MRSFHPRVNSVEVEWHEIRKFVLTHGLVKMDMKKCSALDFWRPIIKARQKFPRFHIILNCVLARSPTSADLECLCCLPSRINWVDHRSLEMDMLEKLLIVAWDNLLFTVHDFDPVVEVYRKKRRACVLRSERAHKGIQT